MLLIPKVNAGCFCRWGEEEYWRRLEEEERLWEEQEHQHHEVDIMDWERRNRMGPPRPDFLPPDMVWPENSCYKIFCLFTGFKIMIYD